MKVQKLTIKNIHKGLEEKKYSAEEITKAYFEEIKKQDGEIGAFLYISEKSALAAAKEVDDLISKGERIPLLAGAPMAVKDNILTKGMKCTAGSKILSSYIAPYDATCLKKLKKQKVVILGKTNLDEFAMGSSTEHSAFKKTRNPNDLSRVPGGSSGGSAAAVKAGESCFALGSDTGGSIRQPAAFCGVVGLKPTYGAVSRYGLIAFASSLDQIGPITKTVEDCQIVFEAIKGKDNLDSTSVNASFNSKKLDSFFQKQFRSEKNRLKGLRIGIPKEYFQEGISEGVGKVMEASIKKLEKRGAEIMEVSLPHTKYALSCYYIIADSEASANLARYDGIRFGKAETEGSLERSSSETRGDGFGEEVKRRIMLGVFTLSSGYYDAYYLKAQKVRMLIRRDFERVFQKVDFIFTPVSPFVAFKLGEKIKDPLKMYLADIFTAPTNLAGLPALSLPCGESEGLPVGGQIIGKAFSEEKIFELGKIIEQNN